MLILQLFNRDAVFVGVPEIVGKQALESMRRARWEEILQVSLGRIERLHRRAVVQKRVSSHTSGPNSACSVFSAKVVDRAVILIEIFARHPERLNVVAQPVALMWDPDMQVDDIVAKRLRRQRKAQAARKEHGRRRSRVDETVGIFRRRARRQAAGGTRDGTNRIKE